MLVPKVSVLERVDCITVDLDCDYGMWFDKISIPGLEIIPGNEIL